MLETLDARLAVKMIGVVAGFLLIGYGFVIAGAGRYDTVANRYASRLSTVGLAIVFVAAGGFLAGSWAALAFEAAGYLALGVGGTVAFRRIATHQQRYEEA